MADTTYTADATHRSKTRMPGVRQLLGWPSLVIACLLATLSLALQADAGSASASGTRPGQFAPAFTLPGERGELSLSSLRGQLVYVDFWASWCEPCRRSFPWMDEMQARYGERGLHIVAINLDEHREAAQDFLRDTSPGFTVLWNPSGSTAERYGLIGMPSSWLIDADGRIVDAHVGFRSRDRQVLEQRIVAALPPPLQAAERSTGPSPASASAPSPVLSPGRHTGEAER